MLPRITYKQSESFVTRVFFKEDDTLLMSTQNNPIQNTWTSYKVNEESMNLEKIATYQPTLEGQCSLITYNPHLSLMGLAMTVSDNKHLVCHIYSVEDGSPLYLKKDLSNSVSDASQSIMYFSHLGKYFISYSNSGVLSVFRVNDWTLAFPALKFRNVKDVCIDMNEEYIAAVLPEKIVILSLIKGDVIHVIDSPKYNKSVTCHFLSCRYNKDRNGNQVLYAVINVENKKKGMICRWNIGKEGCTIGRHRMVGISRSNIVSFSVSNRGDLLAYVSSDMELGLLDTYRMRPILMINYAHSSLHDLIFSPSGRYLASSDGENIMIIPEQIKKYRESDMVTFVYMSLDMLLFALLLHIIVQMADHDMK